MKRILLATGLGAFLAMSASSQIILRQDDGGTDFTSRGAIGGGLNGWATEGWDILGVNETTQWQTVMQDQDCGTLEVFVFVLFGESTVQPNTPDENNVIASTGSFLSPSGTTGTCAWIWTITLASPLAHSAAATGHTIFPGTYLPSNSLWVADGASTHISIYNQGGSPEFPSGTMAATYPPSTPGVGPGATYGSNVVLGSGGGPATTYAGSLRIWNSLNINMAAATPMTGVAYDVRCGTVESPQSAGLYALTGILNPNYGMAGRFPDFTNDTGTAPLREDNLTYQSNSNGLIGGIEQIFLSSGILRNTLGFPIDLPGQGRFELAVPDVLFSASPSIHPAQVVTGTNVQHNLDLDATLIRPAFYSIPVGVGAFLNVYYQGARLDLVTGAVEVSSCRTWQVNR